MAVTLGSRITLGALAPCTVLEHCSVSVRSPAERERPRTVKVHMARGSMKTWLGLGLGLGLGSGLGPGLGLGFGLGFGLGLGLAP